MIRIRESALVDPNVWRPVSPGSGEAAGLDAAGGSAAMAGAEPGIGAAGVLRVDDAESAGAEPLGDNGGVPAEEAPVLGAGAALAKDDFAGGRTAGADEEATGGASARATGLAVVAGAFGWLRGSTAVTAVLPAPDAEVADGVAAAEDAAWLVPVGLPAEGAGLDDAVAAAPTARAASVDAVAAELGGTTAGAAAAPWAGAGAVTAGAAGGRVGVCTGAEGPALPVTPGVADGVAGSGSPGRRAVAVAGGPPGAVAVGGWDGRDGVAAEAPDEAAGDAADETVPAADDDGPDGLELEDSAGDGADEPVPSVVGDAAAPAAGAPVDSGVVRASTGGLAGGGEVEPALAADVELCSEPEGAAAVNDSTGPTRLLGTEGTRSAVRRSSFVSTSQPA